MNPHQNVPSETRPTLGRESDTDRTVFLPTRVFYPNSEASHSHSSHPGVHWESQSVLDWVSSLAHTAEQRGGSGPIEIGDIRLSEPVEAPPQLVEETTGPNKKRTKSTPNDRQHSCPPPPYAAPMYWDLSYIACSDPYVDSPGCQYLSRLRQVAVQYESLLYSYGFGENNKFWNDYQTVQHRLYFLFGRIFAQYPPGTNLSTGPLRSALDTLYRETIQQVQNLMEHITKNSTKKETSRPLTECPMSPPPVTQSSSSPAARSQQTVPKRDMANYLTSWLRDNWTNPYPDEEGVAEMAQICGTTPTVISNWLINARTRKWRPAIVKASELNRPADLLLEDSINIFDGKPVRPLEAWDGSSLMAADGAVPETKKRSR